MVHYIIVWGAYIQSLVYVLATVLADHMTDHVTHHMTVHATLSTGPMLATGVVTFLYPFALLLRATTVAMALKLGGSVVMILLIIST